MKTILVTGGTGFIGSHTVVELLNEGYEVVIVDSLVNSKIVVLDRIQTITNKRPIFYRFDLREEDKLKEVFQKHNIDVVIHFAGFKAVGESCTKPMKYYRNNLDSTITLIETMEKFNCKRIVFSSSATVYSSENSIPYREDYKIGASNPYGQTKIMIEQMLKDVFASDPQWSIALLRYFNPIGAHKSGLLGENPSGIPNNLFPYIQKVATGELPFLSVFGNDYETVDGTGVRDYVHVEDLAQGHIAALNFLKDKHCIEEINLGTGKGTSVLQLVDAFKKMSGKDIPLVFTDRRAGDLPIYYADTSKASLILNWKAKKNIDDMCRDGWNYCQKRKLM